MTPPEAPAPIEARRVRVDAKKFAATWNFVSAEPTRYYLNGVYIEPHVNGGVLMVATDGHTLAAIYDREGEANGQYICPVPPRMVRAARSGRRKLPLDTPQHLHFVGHAAYLTGQHGTDDFNPEAIGPAHIDIAYAPAIDATFPDWRRVIPKFLNDVWKSKEGGYLFTLNGELISRVSDSVRLLSRTKVAPLSFYLGEHESQGPIMVRSGDAPDFFGLIMPMRGEPSAPPYWLENKETAA